MIRVLFYVQNLLGIGHLQRAAVIARALAAAGFAVDFVSGGMPVPGLALGGARLVQLPPARVADEHFAGLLDDAGRPVDEAWRARRRDALLAAAAVARPEVLLIELYPFGRRAFRFELDPLLAAAQAATPRPAVLCSVRDILVDKGRPERRAETVAAVLRWFDAVLVHGDPGFAPLSLSFPEAERIAARLRYTGYVVEAAAGEPVPFQAGTGEVVVSAGGGAVGRPLVEAALQARSRSLAAGLPWRVVLGTGYPQREAAALLAAPPRGVRVERFRPDLARLFPQAALSISQAGYNTVMELLAAGTPAVVVPFAGGVETEQTLRARLLAERGLIHLVEEAGLAPAALAAAMDRALSAPRPTPGGGLDLGGAARTAAILAEAVAWRRAPRHDGLAPGSGAAKLGTPNP
jgi:predicted glycosyltransferase